MSREKPNLYDTAALRALAEGVDFPAEREENYSPSETPSPKTAHTINTKLDGRYVGEPRSRQPMRNMENPLQNQTSNGISAAPRRRATRVTGRANYHAGIHFRKTIIPLLLLMAIILVAAGVFTLVKVNNSSPELIANNPFLSNGKLFAGVSISLGVCLIAGSLFFQYEVRKHHRQNGSGKK
ncbi:MAG: hypothetical protein JW849_03290 [Phycisphaerae bacterium]|nr:hypothetical protein [Phycisphaerae bacterium]